MSVKEVSDLSIRASEEPTPSIEVSLDSADESGADLHAILGRALSGYAKDHPSLIATIYSHVGPSVNFHEPCTSEFLIVDGSETFIGLILDTLSENTRLKVRASDYIVPSEGLIEFHIEDGLVYENYEAGSMHVFGAYDDQDTPIEDDGNSNQSASDANGRRKALGRVRAARSDTTVGVIRTKIEHLFGLPAGSVALCDPDGSRLKGHAKIGTLRRRWRNE